MYVIIYLNLEISWQKSKKVHFHYFQTIYDWHKTHLYL